MGVQRQDLWTGATLPLSVDDEAAHRFDLPPGFLYTDGSDLSMQVDFARPLSAVSPRVCASVSTDRLWSCRS